ncbi:hypothetical protein CVT25_006591 [Psilocybe cyanescens]|uniref:Uncharacterized protein n=1 Tax=Psilocybe cyanescens TaxID=93625 RepID=A0A409X423_PSICY|nr:hypothetical protein CVT25_006591 [Psilocybe cyanescens]
MAGVTSLASNMRANIPSAGAGVTPAGTSLPRYDLYPAPRNQQQENIHITTTRSAPGMRETRLLRCVRLVYYTVQGQPGSNGYVGMVPTRQGSHQERASADSSLEEGEKVMQMTGPTRRKGRSVGGANAGMISNKTISQLRGQQEMVSGFRFILLILLIFQFLFLSPLCFYTIT